MSLHAEPLGPDDGRVVVGKEPLHGERADGVEPAVVGAVHAQQPVGAFPRALRVADDAGGLGNEDFAHHGFHLVGEHEAEVALVLLGQTDDNGVFSQAYRVSL